ncbi:hypothetical protein PGKDCPLP_04621 [Stenotrophomonas maltophilia]|nr:hypothetical protein PGKDCPLP_04621 [Stenotrophomonas maltophilia]
MLPSQRGATSAPIVTLSVTIRTSGMIANGSCIDSTTWLSTSSFTAPWSPNSMITTTTGMIASARVISRRSHGGRRRCRKPSITICPASVAVTVEFRPEASSAIANSVAAAPTPSMGASSWCACSMSSTSNRPLAWNTAAARIRMLALMNSARVSARVLSVTAQRSALRRPSSVRG